MPDDTAAAAPPDPAEAEPEAVQAVESDDQHSPDRPAATSHPFESEQDRAELRRQIRSRAEIVGYRVPVRAALASEEGLKSIAASLGIVRAGG